jgi:flavin-dependent dehydrogenase
LSFTAPTSTPRADVKADLTRSLAVRGVEVGAVKLKPFSTRPFVRESALALDRLALVGEAAGIDATTGEGIAQAILFGQIAAHHLARAIRLGSGDLRGYARDVRSSRVGRHLLQSAWLARVVYGRRGAPWRRFLSRSDRFREAGMRWYAGEPLGRAEKARLAVGLAGELLHRA